ncbi:hypothetical protein CAPTEDRAFT_161211 [Capitella teleta]|uniref:NRDE family protein n=1 Tax=Capitella teleta TaxID=283909 RepID=R7UVS1_CAPTE|nr:hypothetical protein CAPTEDRAFT_161211 [Capitella teleta]|eukprot:ELU10424.1 hypothetical protein CAPTEDRAFT_161211 [Capitella teleta]
MCMLFLYVDNTGRSAHPVVIAFNRDHYYDRPTLPAHFWSPDCISGTDAQPGSEGGTWLGYLVTDFLTSDHTAAEYYSKINLEDYNPFRLILVEKHFERWEASCMSTDGHSLDLSNGINLFTNSSDVTRPWKKHVFGQHLFAKILAEHKGIEQSEELANRLQGLLSDDTTYLPDRNLQDQGYFLSPDDIQTRSSIFMRDPAGKYGTRASTVILINQLDEAIFWEKIIPKRSRSIEEKTIKHLAEIQTHWTSHI